jgi:CobQ-like glutamine amidotransferase family enzyme
MSHKCKLVAKIKWLYMKVKENITEFGNEINLEELEKLPLANLEIMEVQMSKIKLNKKLDLLRGGRGDSQNSVVQDVGN